MKNCSKALSLDSMVICFRFAYDLSKREIQPDLNVWSTLIIRINLFDCGKHKYSGKYPSFSKTEYGKQVPRTAIGREEEEEKSHNSYYECAQVWKNAMTNVSHSCFASAQAPLNYCMPIHLCERLRGKKIKLRGLYTALIAAACIQRQHTM